MKKEYSITNGRSKVASRRKAAELLDWIVDFLPVAIPKTLERAILDESGEVHALFWHRSELQHILEKEPTALDEFQHEKLADVDKNIRASALLLLGAEKGTLQNYREGRYDQSHWWWYLDDLLQEELMAKRREAQNRAQFGGPKQPVSYPAVAEVGESLLKVAEPATTYGPKIEKRKRSTKSK